MRKQFTMEESRTRWEKELKTLCRKCLRGGNCKVCTYSRDSKKVGR